MGVLEGFISTWSQAKATFGEGTPRTGENYDQSGPLRQLQSAVHSAGPGSSWTGGAADTYDTTNTRHGSALGQMAELDRRLGNEVTRSAEIVAHGRRSLDDVRQRVVDAAAAVPPGKNRENLLLPIVSHGLSEVRTIVQTTNSDLNVVGQNIRGVGSGFDEVKLNLFGPDDGTGPQAGQGDENAGGEKSEEEKKDEAVEESGEQGKADGESLADGQLRPEERHRLQQNTTVDPAALDSGDLTVPPQQMAYLTELSHSMDGKSPAEIKSMLDALPDQDARAVSGALHLAGSDRLHTDVDPTLEPGDVGYVPATGGRENLPQSIQDVFDAPLLNDPSGEWITTGDGAKIHLPPDYNDPYKHLAEYRDIAAISAYGDPALQRSSALNEGMLAESRELLEHFESNAWPNYDNAWGHRNLDPTLQELLTSASHDPVAVADMVAGQDTVAGDNFMHDLYRHDWADDGKAVGTLFPDPLDHSERAGQTMHAFDAYAAGHYQEMLDMAGKDSLGQVNPELVRALGAANVPYIDDMAGANLDGTRGFAPLDEGVNANNTRNLFAVIDSDDVAAKDFNAHAANTWRDIVADYSQDLAKTGVPDGELLQAVGKLQGAMDMGEYLHQLDSGKDSHAAAIAAWEKKGEWYDSIKTIAGEVPGVDKAVGIYDKVPGDPLRQFFVGEQPSTPDPSHPMGLRDMDKLSQSVAAYLVADKYGDFGGMGEFVFTDGPYAGQLDWNNPGAQKWIDEYISRVHGGNELPWIKYSDQYWASIYVGEDEYDWLLPK